MFMVKVEVILKLKMCIRDRYWTESKERVGIVEKVMNDGSIGSTFNEGHLTVDGEDAYCCLLYTSRCV